MQKPEGEIKKTTRGGYSPFGKMKDFVQCNLPRKSETERFTGSR